MTVGETFAAPAKRLRVSELDFIRAIACLSIVLLHAIEAAPMHTLGSEVVALLLKAGTPIFVMVSAFLMAYAYPQGTPAGFLRKRAKALVPPLLIIGALYAVLDFIGTGRNLGELAQTYAYFTFGGGYHGYFIIIVLQFYALYKLFGHRLAAIPSKWILGVALIVNLTYWAVFNFVPAPATDFGVYVWVRLSWLPVFGWLFYFAVAYVCGRDFPRFRRQLRASSWELIAAVVALGMSVVLFYVAGGIPDHSSKRVDMVFFASALFCTLFWLGYRYFQNSRWAAFVGRYSFGIYLLHFACMHIAGAFLNDYTMPAPLYVAAMFLSGLVGSVAMTYAASKLPYGQMAVGKLPRP